MSAFRKGCLATTAGLCAVLCAAVVEKHTIPYPRDVRQIRGRVTGYGAVNPGVQVAVFDNAQVWLDESFSVRQAREKQTKLADAQTDERGRFAVRPLPDGFYEVEFQRPGWNIVSLLVHVKRSGADDNLCVELRIESGAGNDRARKCP